MEKQADNRYKITGRPGPIQGNFIYQKQNDFVQYKETEKDLNSKIIKTRMMIHDQFPELSKYLEDMPIRIDGNQNGDERLQKLRAYYESLHELFNRYKLEHHFRSK